MMGKHAREIWCVRMADVFLGAMMEHRVVLEQFVARCINVLRCVGMGDRVVRRLFACM